MTGSCTGKSAHKKITKFSVRSKSNELEWWADTWMMEYALKYQNMLYPQYPQQVLTLLLSEQPHPTTGWLQSLPGSGSYTNPWPEMDDPHQQHQKEGQLHPRLLVQKPSVLPT